ncbi:MAG: biotin--[acetyl-CoA-carboxylase] ligase [Chloroflexi bacterium]|nr:biotin--[acetyl-CoA-carboxylase] ligase [Chloroflexota bacterium]
MGGRPRSSRPRSVARRLTTYRYDSLPSTQTVARQLAESGAEEWTAVLAGEQTAGRGRLERGFYSPPGGLYVSVILRPRVAPAQAPFAALVAGLAQAEAIEGICGVRAVLKWPNDLLLRGRKLSGLLAESAVLGDSLDYILLGIGINANVSGFTTELATSATSLRIELDREFNLDALWSELRSSLQRRFRQWQDAGAEPICRDWRIWPNVLGETVRVTTDTDSWDGIASDVAEDGALLLTTSSGTRRVLAADVRLISRGPKDFGHD